MSGSQEKGFWDKIFARWYYVFGIIAFGFAGFKHIAGYINSSGLIPHNDDVAALEIPSDEDLQSLWIVSLIQAIFVVAILLSAYVTLNVKEKNNRRTSVIKSVIISSIDRLMYSLQYVCLTWILLYLWFAYFWSATPSDFFGYDSQVVLWIVADFFHVCAAFSFFLCFAALEYPTRQSGDAELQERRNKNKLYIALLSLGFFAFSVAGRCKLWNMENIGPLVLAGWTALSMQYFFGKLDSFNLKLPRILIAPLYLYVLVQMMWPSMLGYLSAKETLLILILTFIFKSYFLLLCLYLIKVSRFNGYFNQCARYPARKKN
jgi:hypothetical protein